ncbi:MAG: efflux RND transporter periplasmic adaptor subunit [Desulfovibrionaceae bacterium]|nr:efflux RND transporter periplasmic adaptor subunit [Desulfovibrionaceae bacterium]
MNNVSRSLPAVLRLPMVALLLAAAALPAACTGNDKPTEPAIRPVRVVRVEQGYVGDSILLTGHLRARDETRLAFRLAGKLIARPVDVGDEVGAGQVVARLDDVIERNAKAEAEADLAAARATLEQVKLTEKRTRALLKGDAVSQSDYDDALRQLRTAQAKVDVARAGLHSAEEQLGYTVLKADADGVITEKGAEPGEVVAAGQTVVVLAGRQGRDAIFGMPAATLRQEPAKGQEVEVRLTDNPEIKALGRVREISPQADAATRTFQVKVALADPPRGMFLGSTVVGRFALQGGAFIELPAAALSMAQGAASVWVVDPATHQVHARAVTVERYTPETVILSQGLQADELVVTAGVQDLYEGRTVRLLDN